MTDAPNQTQIEPSVEGLAFCARYGFSEYEGKALLRAAYAIDLAPIIAERDRLRAALKELIAECDGAKHSEIGAGGMSIEAQIARTVIRLPATAVETARAALEDAMSDIILRVGTLLIIETGEYSDRQWHQPVRLLMPVSKTEVAELYRSTFERDEDGDIDQDPDGFLPWLIKEGYVEAVDNVEEWHIGSYGEFKP